MIMFRKGKVLTGLISLILLASLFLCFYSVPSAHATLSEIPLINNFVIDGIPGELGIDGLYPANTHFATTIAAMGEAMNVTASGFITHVYSPPIRPYGINFPSNVTVVCGIWPITAGTYGSTAVPSGFPLEVSLNNYTTSQLSLSATRYDFYFSGNQTYVRINQKIGLAIFLLNNTGLGGSDFLDVMGYQPDSYTGNGIENFASTIPVSENDTWGNTNPYDFPFTVYGYPVSLGADLENNPGSPDWVYTNWRYYTFTATIPSQVNTAALMFTLPCSAINGSFDVLCGVTNQAGVVSLFTNETSEASLNSPVRVRDAGVFTYDAVNGQTVTFQMMFTDRCVDVYALSGITVSLGWNTTLGSASGWYNFTSFFRVYNKGGFSQDYTVSQGSGEQMASGNPFALGCGNASDVSNTIWYNDLGHIQMQPTIAFISGQQVFQQFGEVDYCLGDNTWHPGLQYFITVDQVSYTGIFAGNIWVNMTIDWYAPSSYGSPWNLVKTDNVYMFYHGWVTGSGQEADMKLWVDWYFDNTNGTTSISGRINTYEYPMQDNAAPWLHWLANNWGVKDDVDHSSQCTVPLIVYGADGSATQISTTQMSMERVLSGLYVIPYNANQFVIMDKFDTFQKISGGFPDQGVTTPQFPDTLMPAVAQYGLLGAIWSGLSAMGAFISSNILFGGLALWPLFVNFLDTIASWLGMPHGFTNLITWIGSGWSWLVSSFLYAITLIGSIFTFLFSTIGSFIWAIGQALVSFANTIGMISNFLSGGIGNVGNLWNQLGLTTWFTIGVIFYPLYLVWLWEQEGMDAVIKQLSMIWNIVSWLAHFFIQVIQTIITVISGVIESIPVVE